VEEGEPEEMLEEESEEVSEGESKDKLGGAESKLVAPAQSAKPGYGNRSSRLCTIL